MSTYSIKLKEINKKWFIVDASNLVLGRLAVEVAKILRGKHKPEFTPHMDCGDNVIIINAEKVHLTGNKLDKRFGKKYYYHTNHPGGIKELNAGTLITGRFPNRIVEKAIERMISRGPLARKQMKNLHVYKGGEHPHTAQQPEVLDIVAMNAKNQKRN